MIINTTTTCSLVKKTPPFKVWFGQKPQQIRLDYLRTELASVNNDLLYINNEEFSDNPVLLEIEKQVAKHNL